MILIVILICVIEIIAMLYRIILGVVDLTTDFKVISLRRASLKKL